MAHGPCGEEFKTAFSCFVFSEEEPKGMDCIEKFQYVISHDQSHFQILTCLQGNARVLQEVPRDLRCRAR